MTNIIDYIKWRGDLPFSVSGFNEVDNLIFASLSFIDFSEIVPSSSYTSQVMLSECLDFNRIRFPHGENFGAIVPRDNNKLLECAATSERFKDVYVTCFRNETDEKETKQFAAVTFILPDNSLYVSYRGTDDTLIGWKEDFAFSYDTETEAQKSSVDYLEEIASYFSGPIRVGGHSKGGNLSMYAAAFASEATKDRIITVYNNDGPGFMKEVFDSPEMNSISGKIYTLVPQSSIVGMLLEHSEDFQVIESVESNGATQHNPFSWCVEGTAFRHLDELSRDGKKHEEVFREWIENSSIEDREKLTDTLFTILASSGAKTLSGITADRFHNMGAMVKTFVGMEKETRDHAINLIKSLIDASLSD